MTELSPAAQVAITAFDDRYELCGPLEDHWHEVCLAATFRALADHQQAPIAPGQPIDHWSPDDRTRRELRNLAEELEGHA